MEIPLIRPFHLCRKSLFYQSGRSDRRRVLTEKECEKLETGSEEGTIDYKHLYEERYPVLQKSL